MQNPGDGSLKANVNAYEPWSKLLKGDNIGSYIGDYYRVSRGILRV